MCHDVSLFVGSAAGACDDKAPPQLPRVTAITAYSKGFACSAGPGAVWMFEKTDDKDNYKKTRQIRVICCPSVSETRRRNPI